MGVRGLNRRVCELWARWGPEADRDFWKEAAAASRNFFQKAANPKTCLTPDYANFDGTPVGFGPANFGSTFAADDWRTVANWSIDWAWWAADRRERELSDRIQSFFMSNGIDRYGSKYSLDGMQMNDTAHAAALVATNAIASLAATDQERAAKFAAALWNTPIPSGRYRYYDGLWYLMALMHDGGAFRVWDPGKSETRRRGKTAWHLQTLQQWEAFMSKTLTLSQPQLGFVVGTRIALALGVGLLISRRLSESRRRRIGRTLVAVGLATTVPAVMFVTRGRRASRG